MDDSKLPFHLKVKRISVSGNDYQEHHISYFNTMRFEIPENAFLGLHCDGMFPNSILTFIELTSLAILIVRDVNFIKVNISSSIDKYAPDKSSSIDKYASDDRPTSHNV